MKQTPLQASRGGARLKRRSPGGIGLPALYNDKENKDGMFDPNASKLSSIKTYMLVALIFNILAILVWLVASLAIFPVLWLILSILVLALRVMPMRSAAESGDIARLKSLNSVVWGIVALIFAGIIPGIMMLLATGPINELVVQPTTMAGSMATTAAPAAPAAGPVQAVGDVKYCQSCGTQMAKSAAFCPKCGAAQH